jgi:Transposase IS116/IS110/IS902 family
LSVYHLAAWAGVCPGDHESAGRQKSGRARKGNVHLPTILVGAAISAARTKGSYLKDKFHRLKARRGALRAALAIAHKILVSAYHMLARSLPYRELGEAYLGIVQTRTVANLKRRLERARLSRHPGTQGSAHVTPAPGSSSSPAVTRQNHVAGEKAFVDYSGTRIGIADPETGEIREAAGANGEEKVSNAKARVYEPACTRPGNQGPNHFAREPSALVFWYECCKQMRKYSFSLIGRVNKSL